MAESLCIGKATWKWGKRTYIMGILNITPDSFSDGGRFYEYDTALMHARRMAADGADIIDIGGESTRPGHTAVSAEQEMERIIPVIELLVKEIDIPVSVDTYKARTAEAALRAGVHMVNDVWGLKADSDMAYVVAQYQVPVCIMHNKENTQYLNLMKDILEELSESIEIALKAGIKDENIILDPGIGFGKTWEQNLEVMRHLEDLRQLGYPVLLGTSRKSFIGKTLNLETDERLEGTLATTVTGIIKGVDIVRVHDVLQNKRAALMTDRMVR